MPKCLAVGFTLPAMAELGSGLAQRSFPCSSSVLGISTMQERCWPLPACDCRRSLGTTDCQFLWEKRDAHSWEQPRPGDGFFRCALGTIPEKLKQRKRPTNKISVSGFIYELVLHFLPIQDYVPKYQIAWSGIAVATSFFSLVCFQFLWIPLFSQCQEAAWGADPNFRLPSEGEQPGETGIADTGTEWSSEFPWRVSGIFLRICKLENTSAKSEGREKTAPPL